MKLKKGEVKCDKCKGKGKIPAKDHPRVYISTEGSLFECPKCFGTGKLDWVENIVGKRKDENISGKPRNVFRRRCNENKI